MLYGTSATLLRLIRSWHENHSRNRVVTIDLLDYSGWLGLPKPQRMSSAKFRKEGGLEIGQDLPVQTVG